MGQEQGVLEATVSFFFLLAEKKITKNNIGKKIANKNIFLLGGVNSYKEVDVHD
jgi:hypothetical protein